MIIRCVLLAFSLIGAAQATEWEASLASVPSLRTAGARLVSSDAIEINDDRYALITYWESRTEENLDFYRCVDISDSSFDVISQNCWKALRPTGRAPATFSDVTSSGDICGQPDDGSGSAEVAFCAFSRSFVLSTPFFELTLSPFERGGLVAVRERGRHLLVVDEHLPASVVFEVRSGELATHPELSGLTSMEELVSMPPEGYHCATEEFAGRLWAECASARSSSSVVRYLIDDDTVYQVGFNTDASAVDQTNIRFMMQSLRPKSP